jgi:hypothetical protein
MFVTDRQLVRTPRGVALSLVCPNNGEAAGGPAKTQRRFGAFRQMLSLLTAPINLSSLSAADDIAAMMCLHAQYTRTELL